MSDEYKDRYIIIALLNTPLGTTDNREHHSELYSRSTAKTAMNPIGQTIPVIHLHLEGKSEQTHQLLN